MRLSEWRKAAPKNGVLDDRVLAVIGPVLTDLGAEPNPECWVAWGEDPDMRYSLLSPTLVGLITVAIRFTTPEEGPRVLGKLVRWSKVSVSDLGLEAGGGHRLVAVQVENIVLKGMDEEADRICDFVRILIAGVDDRLVGPGQMSYLGSVPQVAATPSVTESLPDAAPRPPKAPRDAASKPAPPPGALVPVVAVAGPTPKVAKPAAQLQVPLVSAPAASAPASDAPSGKAPRPHAPSEAAAGSEQSTAPTPIAARAAARSGVALPEQAAPAPQDGEAEPEPDRSGWVSPHAIEQAPPPPPKPAKPRTWMP